MLSTEWEFKVRFGETDAAGIAYYPNFYKWMDQASHEMFGAIGYSTRKLLAEQLGIPLLEAHCQFRKPLLFEDLAKVVSTVQEVGNKTVKIGHAIYRGEEVVAEGYEVRAWITGSSGQIKATAIPDPLRAALTAGGDH
ncbi:acyl-CoA thioesterase [Cohnella caldifontis]|uniref:acyl-CoA thioesterase n=1 Tax=Cohnella caldifontis TaxID=3027471 RepID=UPI0023EBF9B8|nr:thioesterase family protein [Cohnella sp. YIM B05605]